MNNRHSYIKDKTTLVTILVGPPCSGKSTYLKTLEHDFVISSDDIVLILCQRAGIQYHEFFKYSSTSGIRQQHDEIFTQLIKGSKSFAHVVWDLTSLTKKSRKLIMNHYPHVTFNAVVFNFCGNEQLILQRNQQRFKQQGKNVNEAVIKAMFKRYQAVTADEGFHEVTVVQLSNGELTYYS